MWNWRGEQNVSVLKESKAMAKSFLVPQDVAFVSKILLYTGELNVRKKN